MEIQGGKEIRYSNVRHVSQTVTSHASEEAHVSVRQRDELTSYFYCNMYYIMKLRNYEKYVVYLTILEQGKCLI